MGKALEEVSTNNDMVMRGFKNAYLMYLIQINIKDLQLMTVMEVILFLALIAACLSRILMINNNNAIILSSEDEPSIDKPSLKMSMAPFNLPQTLFAPLASQVGPLVK